MRRLKRIAFACVTSLLLASVAGAVGTGAGTSIPNTATVDYFMGGTPVSETSNQATIIVAEVLDVDVTLLTVTSNPNNEVTVEPGDTQQVLTFSVTNTGNGTDTYGLTVLSGGGFNGSGNDTFDPINPLIYLDDGATPGVFDATDTLYDPNVDDPTLLADDTVTIHVLNDIGATALDGDLGDSQLTATSQDLAQFPATPSAGDSVAGQGDLGGDLVLGTALGNDSEYGTYLVTRLTVDLVKSSVVLNDPVNGATNPVPVIGATIEYTLVVEVRGSGAANALVIGDAVPTNTTYVNESMQLNAVAQTDAIDSPTDEASFDPVGGPANNGAISVDLGAVTAVDGPQTITFQVTID